MKHLAPECFRDFACAAGSCPDSCCRAGWEIVIDPETRKKYETMTGPDGSRVRSAVLEGDEPLLQMEGGVCTLLEPDGLCFCQKRFGHEALCRVCREYPRFHREFGNLTEHGISLSCPTAFALATGKAPALTEWEDERPIVPNDLDPERYLLLRRGRELALSILAEEGRPLRDRVNLVLTLAERLQKGLNGSKRAGELALKRLASPIGQKAALRPGRIRDDCADLAGLLLALARIFSGLEILSPDWKTALAAFAARLEADGVPEDLFEPEQPEVYARYLWYSLYKYWLDAADDGALLPRVRRSAAMTLLGLAMDRIIPGERSWLQRISREIEHCEENLAALLK
ncbi:MAG: flagellin lysine-N-methylase [Oscillospiraceae bacterium]|nr:flagellin lysine-N-methylase [Oscillospiraceae bacterium]